MKYLIILLTIGTMGSIIAGDITVTNSSSKPVMVIFNFVKEKKVIDTQMIIPGETKKVVYRGNPEVVTFNNVFSIKKIPLTPNGHYTYSDDGVNVASKEEAKEPKK